MPEPEYTFKHALTQDVAYNSLLLERRRALHERTAQAIETLFQDRLEERYHELAHHYSRSGNTAKAVEYLQRAGQQALQRSAYAEAIHHLTAALDLLKTLPAHTERLQQELVVQTTLGPAFIATRSYAAPEVAQVYTRARELCQQLGEGPSGPAPTQSRQGQFTPLTWDEALDMIHTRFTAIQQQYGPEAIMPLNYAGPHGFLAAGSMDLRFFHKLGASRLARRPLCGGVKSEAFLGTYGAVPLMRPEHVAAAQLVIV